MGFDPISVGIMGLSGVRAYQQYQAGLEAQKKYNEIATEEYRQGAFAQRMGLEHMKELTEAGQEAGGQAIAAAGKAGVRVAGSVATLTERIRAKVERRKLLLGAETVEQVRRHQVAAGEYRSAGRAARAAGGRQALLSLLTGTYLAAKHNIGKGRKWWDIRTGRSESLGYLGGYRQTGYGTYK